MFAACQGSTSHHEGSKETSEVGRSEVKGKKSSSHGSSHKGKKTGSGKSSAGFSSASSSSAFQPAGRGEGGGGGVAVMARFDSRWYLCYLYHRGTSSEHVL